MAAMTTGRRPLEDYLNMAYPFQVEVLEDGGYFISFPDLDGCWSDADRIEDIPARAEESRRLWIATAYEEGAAIPLPSVRS